MKSDIVRSWKDESYRQTLSKEDLASLPANPVGFIDLTDAELGHVFGGGGGGGFPGAGGPGAGGAPGGGAGGGAGAGGAGAGGAGGVGGVGGVGGFGGVGGVSVTRSFLSEHNESLAVICEINIYSISILSNIAILGHVTQACVKA